jgi:biotin carboxyl carrier protein
MEIQLGGKARTIEVERTGERVDCAIDGRALEASAVEVAPGVYSILIGGASLEARVEPSAMGLRVIVARHEYAATIRDPRQWRRDRGAAAQAEGRQQVLAPMPGKIVRVLVKAGETVQAGQGIVVVEAMKMQNEVRAPKSGILERLLVTENQAVSTGELLAVVA